MWIFCLCCSLFWGFEVVEGGLSDGCWVGMRGWLAVEMVFATHFVIIVLDCRIGIMDEV